MPEQEITREDVEGALGALVACGSVDAAFAYLSELDCRGVRGDSSNCPVAVYLNRTLDTEVLVTALLVEVFDPDTGLVIHRVALPSLVVDVVAQFDAGAWLSLVDRPEALEV